MSALESTVDESRRPARSDFSLVLGGPLFQLWRRTRLSGNALEWVHRRIVAFVLVTWVPLLVLSILDGNLWGSGKLSFLQDIEVHVRFLLALPLLIIAELNVHGRLREVIEQFLVRGIVSGEGRAQFDAAVASAVRLRNSVVAELLMIAIVVMGVSFVWRSQMTLDLMSWYGTPAGGVLLPSRAGWWLGCVSLPVFQFLLLRWYYRIFIWARLMVQVSRIDLKLVPTHPDRCAGIGFVAFVAIAFSPLLLAQGALLAGMMANRIFYSGAQLPEFQLELIAVVIVIMLAVLGPLMAFTPKLFTVKRNGLREYGALAQNYVREFDRKWVRGGAPSDEPFIGSADIQSLADLGNSFGVVKEMRVVPFTLRVVVYLVIMTLLPVAPLLLTMIPLSELLSRMLNLVF